MSNSHTDFVISSRTKEDPSCHLLGFKPTTTPSQVRWLLKFYVLEPSMVISGQVLTCDSGHSWWLCSAAQLGNQTAGTMTQYPTQSHYLGTKLTSPCPILSMLTEHHFKSHWFDSTVNQTPNHPHARLAFYRFGHCVLFWPSSSSLAHGKQSQIYPPTHHVEESHGELHLGYSLILSTTYIVSIWRCW